MCIRDSYNTEDLEILEVNPLVYLDLWKNLKIEKEKVEIYDFYVSHPRIEDKLTLQNLIDDQTIKEDIKNRILNEVIDGWVKEYNDYIKFTIQNVNHWADAMIEDVEYYRIPSPYKTIGIIVVFAFVFISYFSDLPFLRLFNTSIHTVSWYNIFFVFILLGTITYILRTDLFRQLVRNVKVIWKKQIAKHVSKINKKREKFEFEFQYLVEKDEMINKKKVLKKLDIVDSTNEEINKLKKRIFLFEKGYVKMLSNYEKRLHFKDIVFYILSISFGIYIILGIVLGKGWI